MPVGRIVYTRQALPAVEMVNFALVGGDIVIRTSAEGKLAAATRGAVVAFEADSVDLAERTGWSVTIVGQARAVTDGAEIRRLERAAPPSWVTGQSGHFIRISPAMVNGRRVAPAPSPPPGDHPLVSSRHAAAKARRLGPKGPAGCDVRP